MSGCPCAGSWPCSGLYWQMYSRQGEGRETAPEVLCLTQARCARLRCCRPSAAEVVGSLTEVCQNGFWAEAHGIRDVETTEFVLLCEQVGGGRSFLTYLRGVYRETPGSTQWQNSCRMGNSGLIQGTRWLILLACLILIMRVEMLDQGWRDIEHLRDALNATEQSLSSLMQLTAWYGGYSKWAPDVPNLICYRNLRKSIKILREEHTGLVIHA